MLIAGPTSGTHDESPQLCNSARQLSTSARRRQRLLSRANGLVVEHSESAAAAARSRPPASRCARAWSKQRVAEAVLEVGSADPAPYLPIPCRQDFRHFSSLEQRLYLVLYRAVPPSWVANRVASAAIAVCTSFRLFTPPIARNRTRAARRIAEKTRRNALAREAAIEIAESRPKRQYARTKTQLEVLASRGNISQEHRRAGERLDSSWTVSWPRGQRSWPISMS
jgi:hypothetical protein